MKKLIIILLLASKVCSGQSGSVALNDSAGVIFIGSDASVPYGKIPAGDFSHSGEYDGFKQDTIPVLMLICDTLHYTNHTPQLNNKNYFDKSGIATWVLGNQVRRWHCCIEGNTSTLAYSRQIPYYTHLMYLDSDLKPLSKYIMVWMAQ